MLGLFPDDNEEKVEELEKEISELEEEVERLEEMYESEKERRSQLSREKQEAQEELNRLEDRVRNLEEEEESEEAEKVRDFSQVEMEEFLSLLEKIGQIESGERELYSVFIGDSAGELEDVERLKDSLGSKTFNLVNDLENCIVFTDGRHLNFVFKTKSFFDGEWTIGEEFKTRKVREVLEKEKYFVVLGSGDSRIYSESGGEFELVERIKNRVDRSHSKGGFSQKRFERKREEQVEQHLEEVREAVPEGEIFLLGDRRLCKEVEGRYIGGFDDNMDLPEAFYGFQVLEPGWF